MINDIKKLKELDIVRRRDGKICIILKSEIDKKLHTYSLSLQALHPIHRYADDFTYGKLIYSNRGKEKLISENLYRNKDYDIVAVARPKSMKKLLKFMKDFEIAVRRRDESSRNLCIESLDWLDVDVLNRNMYKLDELEM